MRVWIDARGVDHTLTVFGLSLLERQLKGLLSLPSAGKAADSASLEEVHVELAPGSPIPRLPHAVAQALPLCWSQSGQSARGCLERLLSEPGGGPLLALSADTVVDPRLVGHLLRARGSTALRGPGGGSAARLEGPLPEPGDDALELDGLVRAWLEAGAVKAFDLGAFDAYIPRLRRSLPPHLIPIPDAPAARSAERRLFEWNYKGSTDFLTKHVYPPLVWRLLLPLARWRVHPNSVTLVSIAATVAAIPLFASGAWLSGLLLAFVMSVLDSVDGKLARVTFTASPLGNILDHGTDLVHPPFWYCAWAWGLCGGDTGTLVFRASLWMAALYVVDRLIETTFKLRTGSPLQAYRPLDVRLRTFASRRNVNLAIFCAGLPLGLGTAALFAIVALQAATAAYHLVRLVQFWSPAARERSPVPALAARWSGGLGSAWGAGPAFERPRRNP